MSEYSVEELREIAKRGDGFRPGHTLGDIATSYADLLERVKADEGAVPVAWCALTLNGQIAYFDGRLMVMRGNVGNELHPVPLFTRPPAQAAQAGAQDATEVHAALEAWGQAHKKLNDSMNSIRRFAAAPSAPEGDGGAA